MIPGFVVAYCGPAPAPSEWLARWNLDPLLLAALAAVSLLALSGRIDGLRRRPAALALGVLFLAFVSPLCALSSALFSARVVHHLLLIAVAAPLIAAALPRSRPGGLAVWTAAHAAILWLWHAPGPYGWGLASDAAYWLMQVSLLGSGVMFWRAVRGASAPLATVAVLVSMVQMGLLGALITFAAQPLYAPHATTTLAWGLSALQDQQIAGLIMWAPGAGTYLAAALWIVGRWMAREDRGLTVRPA